MRSILRVALLPAVLWLAVPALSQSTYTAIGRFEEPPPGTRSRNAASAGIWELFYAARADAASVTFWKVCRNLTPIREGDPATKWKGEGARKRVLLAVWTSWNGYDGLVGRETALTRDVWVTVVSQIKSFCASNVIPANALTLRLEQLIGLPPDGSRTRFVEMWASPEDLFRPSPDPEITDQEAEIDFRQPSRFQVVSQDHVKWISDLRAISYGATGMPWTRLGYTYDWGSRDSHVGLSEYVIRSGATVEIESVSQTAEYCATAGSERPAPRISAGGVVNAASGRGDAVAPGEWLSLYGAGLGPAAPEGADSPTHGLAGTRVFFNGLEAPIGYASASQLNVVAPWGIEGMAAVDIEVQYEGAMSNTLSLSVALAAPGVFAAAWNEDGTVNSASNPAARGSVVTLWVTGQGQTVPAGSDARRVWSAEVARPRQPVTITVGGVSVAPQDVRFTGMVGPGLLLLKMPIPSSLPPGNTAEVLVACGGALSQRGVLLAVR